MTRFVLVLKPLFCFFLIWCLDPTGVFASDCESDREVAKIREIFRNLAQNQSGVEATLIGTILDRIDHVLSGLQRESWRIEHHYELNRLLLQLESRQFVADIPKVRLLVEGSRAIVSHVLNTGRHLSATEIRDMGQTIHQLKDWTTIPKTGTDSEPPRDRLQETQNLAELDRWAEAFQLLQEDIKHVDVFDKAMQHLLLEQRLLTPEQIRECFREQKRIKRHNPSMTLLGVVLSKQLLPADTVFNLSRLRNESGLTLIPGYEIQGLIGQGGMSLVYLANSLFYPYRVALKLFVPEPGSDISADLARFRREVTTMGSLSHPNIGQAYIFGQALGFHFFVMEYIAGQDLDTLVKQRGRLTEVEALTVFGQVLSALRYAWKANLIHRDIKPSNIVIENWGSLKMRAKVVDFGLVKPIRSDMELTRANAVLGTPYYMSPDQITQGKLDYRSDVYSLGVVLYYMLAGRVPFTGEGVITVLGKHVDETPERPHNGISNPVWSFVLKMMDKDPKQRCKDPDDLYREYLRTLRQVTLR